MLRRCADLGFTHYVYAPKDDPFHRDRWREPYAGTDVDHFGALVADAPVQVGFAVSPGLSMRYDEPDDRRDLLAKITQMTQVGVRLVCVCLDDIEPRPGLGADHASLVRWLRHELDDDVELVLVPTDYTSTSPNEYLEALAAVPADVPIAWTGPQVVCDEITADDAARRATVAGARKPLLWDNYPVNDALMADQLFLGASRGRSPALVDACAGWLANPGVQAVASLPALASIAALLDGDDVDDGWWAEVERLDVAVLAAGCVGAAPNDLVHRLAGASTGDRRRAALDEARHWFTLASTCTTSGLGDDVEPWAAQLRAEADVALVAIRCLRRLWASDTGTPDIDGATSQGLALTVLWPPVRRSAVTVLGPRLSFRPTFSQSATGTWRWHADGMTSGANALDALCHLALAELAAAGG